MRARVAVAAATAAVLVAVGAAAAAAPPATPAGRQLAWVVEQLNTGRAPAEPALAEHFAPSLLAALPPQRLAAVLASIAASRPFRPGAVVEQSGDTGLQMRIDGRLGVGYRVSIHVEADSAHLIDGLVFRPAPAAVAGWDGVDAALRRAAAHAGLYAGRVDGRTVHALAADRVAPVGSAFKLYVLGALTDAVAAGTARWDEGLAIRDAWKSLPSGAMRDEPAGRRFSLRHFAE